MLIFEGVLRAAVQLGGGVARKTGEVVPIRYVLQVEDLDDRGLVTMHTVTVPDLEAYRGREGERVSLPVRAWSPGSQVNLVYAGGK